MNLAQHGLKIAGGKLVADGKNPEATRQFLAELRAAADQAEKGSAAASAHGKARRLMQSARAARRDAERIEKTI